MPEQKVVLLQNYILSNKFYEICIFYGKTKEHQANANTIRERYVDRE